MRPSLSLVSLLAGLALTAAAADYTPPASVYPVGTIEQTWHDAKRNRDVPVKIYYPVAPRTGVTASFPVIVFSHGLGGSREGYSYLGQYWAGAGYVSVHVQHAGSDSEILRSARPLQGLLKAESDPQVALNRPLDISFAIDRLTALNSDPSFALQGRLDLGRLGVAGHSFGAFTTMAVAGAHLPVMGTDLRYADPRVKAAIAMSTPSNRSSDTDAEFDAVHIPVFHMTGTKDESTGGARESDQATVGHTSAAQRTLPYRHTRNAPADLLVFTGGDHMVFSGRLAGSRPADKEFQTRICRGSVAFWDAWLKGDPAARQWLEGGAFAAEVGNLGTFERKG